MELHAKHARVMRGHGHYDAVGRVSDLHEANWERARQHERVIAPGSEPARYACEERVIDVAYDGRSPVHDLRRSCDASAESDSDRLVSKTDTENRARVHEG